MLAPSDGLLRTGLALKLSQIRLAARSWLRDRTHQATGSATSYAVAAGLFVAAGVFLIAACLVGLSALFRWIEINYGQFYAFGAVGGLLLVIAAICAGLAARKLKQPLPHVPSLGSRLRVAIKASPARPDQIEAVRDTAAAILMTPSTPVTGASQEASRGRPDTRRRPVANGRNVRVGVILAATLLGWAAARRRQVRRTEA